MPSGKELAVCELENGHGNIVELPLKMVIFQNHIGLSEGSQKHDVIS